jgi:hypothetical protein
MTKPGMKQPTQKELEAVAEVIRSVGFTTMAQEFMDRPDDRQRIVSCMVRNIARDGKVAESRRFNQLATWTLSGLWVSA